MRQPARWTRRQLILGMTGGAVAVMIAACGAPEETPAEPSDNRPVTGDALRKVGDTGRADRKAITVWGRQQASPEANIWLTESIKEAAHEGDFDARVELLTAEALDLREMQALEAKQAPDLSMTMLSSRWWRQELAREAADIFSTVGASGGGWYAAPDAASLMDGKRIGVPMTVEPWMLVLRRDLFEKAGVPVPFTSFEAMVDGFKAVTTGTLHGFGGPLTSAAWIGNVLCAMLAHGGRLFDQDGKATIDTPQNLAGLTAYTNLALKHKVMPPGVTTWDDVATEKAWLSGQVAAIAANLSTVQALRGANQALLDATLVMPWPGAQGAPAITTADSLLMVVNRTSPTPDLAAKVISKVLSKERLPGGLTAAAGAWHAPLKAYHTSEAYARERWSRTIQQEVVPQSVSPFAGGGRNAVLEELSGAAIGDALQMIAVGGKSPQEALRWLDAQARAAEQKLGKK